MIPIFYAGIDIGSTMTKVAITDDEANLIASLVQNTGAEHRRQANLVMEEALGSSGLAFEKIDRIIATGYGRMNVPFADKQVSELSCHARGVSHEFPGVRLAIDIGGQDSKALKIINGKLIDFMMNDKCAAGTGRFLDVIAEGLGIKIEDLGDISMRSTRKISISSTCTVFAQQEVTSHLSEGAAIEDVVAGLHSAIASRVTKMARKLKPEPEIVFTGGVAKNSGVVRALSESLGHEVHVPKNPLLSGALGAALLAREQARKAIEKGEPVRKADRRLDETTFFNGEVR